MRKKRKWPVIVALIGTFLIIGIAAALLILSQHTLGTIELPAELPSPKMMAQIAANLDLLSKPNPLPVLIAWALLPLLTTQTRTACRS